MSEIKKYEKWLEDAIVQANISNIFDNLLTIAVEKWASDIHIEPYEYHSRIRLREDGILFELIQFPSNIHESIIAKFKIESWQMRPDEKRLPQDARVSTTTLTNKDIDLRANTLPTVWWEKLCIRIVDKSEETPPITKLWVEGVNNDILFNNIESPNWIILTTWPTWSGKSTTMYSSLSYINREDVNITTYEDPVENKVEWINQSQMKSDIWYTFASWLRAALRQDPDIILVWEIRDQETLETAMEAAMTWHLVFSTLHANSAAETITRIVNMWAEPYMLAGTFNIIMAQRLARRVCTKCKTTYNIKENNPKFYKHAKETLQEMDQRYIRREIKKREIDDKKWKQFIQNWIAYKWTWKDPKNWETCPRCWGSWYKWRTGIYEILEFNNRIKEKVLDWVNAFWLELYALDKWMINLERDWILKAIQWTIDFKEVYRLTKHKTLK